MSKPTQPRLVTKRLRKNSICSVTNSESLRHTTDYDVRRYKSEPHTFVRPGSIRGKPSVLPQTFVTFSRWQSFMRWTRLNTHETFMSWLRIALFIQVNWTASNWSNARRHYFRALSRAAVGKYKTAMHNYFMQTLFATLREMESTRITLPTSPS